MIIPASFPQAVATIFTFKYIAIKVTLIYNNNKKLPEWHQIDRTNISYQEPLRRNKNNSLQCKTENSTVTLVAI